MAKFFYIFLLLFCILHECRPMWRKEPTEDIYKCHFSKYRTTELETWPRTKWSTVSTNCSGELWRFADMDVEQIPWDTIPRNLYGADTILDAMLSRGHGWFDWRTEIPEDDLEDFLEYNFVCEQHIRELFTHWRKPQTHYASLRRRSDVWYYCAFPDDYNPLRVSPEIHMNQLGLKHALQKDEARDALNRLGILLHIGIPLCKYHKEAIRKLSANPDPNPYPYWQSSFETEQYGSWSENFANLDENFENFGEKIKDDESPTSSSQMPIKTDAMAIEAALAKKMEIKAKKLAEKGQPSMMDFLFISDDEEEVENTLELEEHMSKSVPVGNSFPDPFKIEVDMLEGRTEPQMIRSASKKSMGGEEGGVSKSLPTEVQLRRESRYLPQRYTHVERTKDEPPYYGPVYDPRRYDGPQVDLGYNNMRRYPRKRIFWKLKPAHEWAPGQRDHFDDPNPNRRRLNAFKVPKIEKPYKYTNSDSEDEEYKPRIPKPFRGWRARLRDAKARKARAEYEKKLAKNAEYDRKLSEKSTDKNPVDSKPNDESSAKKSKKSKCEKMTDEENAKNSEDSKIKKKTDEESSTKNPEKSKSKKKKAHEDNMTNNPENSKSKKKSDEEDSAKNSKNSKSKKKNPDEERSAKKTEKSKSKSKKPDEEGSTKKLENSKSKKKKSNDKERSAKKMEKSNSKKKLEDEINRLKEKWAAKEGSKPIDNMGSRQNIKDEEPSTRIRELEEVRQRGKDREESNIRHLTIKDQVESGRKIKKQVESGAKIKYQVESELKIKDQDEARQRANGREKSKVIGREDERIAKDRAESRSKIKDQVESGSKVKDHETSSSNHRIEDIKRTESIESSPKIRVQLESNVKHQLNAVPSMKNQKEFHLRRREQILPRSISFDRKTIMYQSNERSNTKDQVESGSSNKDQMSSKIKNHEESGSLNLDQKSRYKPDQRSSTKDQKESGSRIKESLSQESSSSKDIKRMESTSPVKEEPTRYRSRILQNIIEEGLKSLILEDEESLEEDQEIQSKSNTKYQEEEPTSRKTNEGSKSMIKKPENELIRSMTEEWDKISSKKASGLNIKDQESNRHHHRNESTVQMKKKEEEPSRSSKNGIGKDQRSDHYQEKTSKHKYSKNQGHDDYDADNDDDDQSHRSHISRRNSVNSKGTDPTDDIDYIYAT